MPICYVCQGQGNFLHLGRFICVSCFLGIINRRVKRHLGRRLFKKGDKLLVIGELEKTLLKQALGNLPVKIIPKKTLPKEIKNYDFVVYGRTMDEVDEEFLEGLFQGKLILDSPKKKFFNLLEPLTSEEAVQYAKIKKIRFKSQTNCSFLEKLKEFKELRYNLYRNIKELRAL